MHPTPLQLQVGRVYIQYVMVVYGGFFVSKKSFSDTLILPAPSGGIRSISARTLFAVTSLHSHYSQIR
ncbi:Uncharacterised protein [Vibrio cholerae]|nr:Uncharacterised protein [Vibrio cholerae]